MDTHTTTLELTADELALLADVLEQDYRDLRQQIGSTEEYHFKENLKAREEMMLGLLKKVTGGRFPP